MQVDVSVRKVSAVLLSVVIELISVHSLLQFFVWQANLTWSELFPTSSIWIPGAAFRRGSGRYRSFWWQRCWR